MKFTIEDEFKIFEEEPELRKFKNNVLAKPNGYAMYNNYLQFRVVAKNDDDVLSRMSPDSTSYNKVKEIVDARFKKLQEMEHELSKPPTTLEKVANAKGVIQTDWWDKAVDVVTRVLSNPEDTTKEPQESQKPSLWEVFFK